MRIKLNKPYIVYIYFCLFLIFLILLFIYNSSSIDQFRKDRYYTSYDSQTFYQIVQDNDFSNLKKLREYDGLAYTAYPIYLFGVKKFLLFFFDDLSYKKLLISNLFILFLCFIFYLYVFKPKSFLEIFPLIVISFEPSILAFSLTLEREIFASFFLAITSYSFIYLKGKIKWIIFILLIYISVNIRAELLIIPLLAILVYKLIIFFKSNSSKIKKCSLGLIFLLSLVYLYIIFGEIFFDTIDFIIKIQLARSDKSGLGGVILNLPLLIRIPVFSFFFLILPLPVFPTITNDFLFPYEMFMFISGISYLTFWIFVFRNLKHIDRKMFFLLIVLLLSHIIFGGFLFNIRHRTDIVILLVTLFLLIIRAKLGYQTIKKIFIEISCYLLISSFIITSLSFLLLFIKM